MLTDQPQNKFLSFTSVRRQCRIRVNKRRIVIDRTSAAWLGWVVLALLAIPLVVLSLFFFAAMVVLLAVARL